MSEPKKKRQIKNKKSPVLTISKWVLGLFMAGILASGAFYLSIYWGFWGRIPNKEALSDLNQQEATEVFSSEGKLIGKYYIFDRQPVLFKELPTHLIDALIATEDIRFYEHSGIDGRSLLRVFFKTILMGDESSGGGSTITLQLAKNLFGRNDYGYLSIVVNKLRESVIAQRLEDIYSKQEILELYFNTVPFSDNTYGIESAARKFFSTTTSDLSLKQSATLVGTLKASHYYNPRLYPDRSRQRRNVVLSQMKKYGYLAPEVYDAIREQPIELDYKFFNSNEGVAPYFRAQVKKEVISILDTLRNSQGESYNIYRDGLQIHTTLDFDMQILTEAAMRKHMSKLQQQFENAYGKAAPWKDPGLFGEALEDTPQYRSLKAKGWDRKDILDSMQREKEMEFFTWEGNKIVQASVADSLQHFMKYLNTGMINIDPSTGAVLSWIGGIDHEFFKYDHVSQSRRQVGSTFKPVVYTAALEAGIPPCTYYPVREVTYAEGWTPSNSGPQEDPYMNYPMETALSRSINTIAVKVLFDAGLDKVLTQAKKMNFPPNLPRYPSIALGTAELSVADLASSYSSFVNGGKVSELYLVTEIRDKYGKVIAKLTPQVSDTPAFSENTRQLMIEMMKTTVEEGTARRLRGEYGLPNDIAGKTGTTQDNKDGWFVGIMPELVSVTWTGVDDHRIGFPSTTIGQGANSALPLFAMLVEKMNADPQFNQITRARFPDPSPRVQRMLDCEPMKRDNFLERLFTQKEKPKKRKQDDGKGIFSAIKDLFKKKENP